MTEQQAPADSKHQRTQKLLAILERLSPGQLFWLEKVINIFDVPGQYEVGDSDIITDEVLHDFGDALKIHHAFSLQPFSKDKFEYVLEQVLLSRKISAERARPGNPGHDITIRSQRVSLKTQADSNIRSNEIWISKFMELGAGSWSSNPDDLIGLRDQFLSHLAKYDRIFTLRTLSRAPDWRYELVEIPKTILERAPSGRLEMMTSSKQIPKPGYCYVSDDNGAPMYELYFDGGGERKLQVKKLRKSFCKVHATWAFSIPKI
jgi:hypothetical protein